MSTRESLLKAVELDKRDMEVLQAEITRLTAKCEWFEKELEQWAKACPHCLTIARDCDRLTAERDSALVDAARYQLVRSLAQAHSPQMSGQMSYRFTPLYRVTGNGIDEAVDKAIVQYAQESEAARVFAESFTRGKHRADDFRH